MQIKNHDMNHNNTSPNTRYISQKPARLILTLAETEYWLLRLFVMYELLTVPSVQLTNVMLQARYVEINQYSRVIHGA